ncbi:MAG: FAD-dependent oxidoreductase [Gammaproteobacteria bacterium]|nr:FAD-dependent oxidoreductase [Gammaproteobacteria bacterium]
MTADSLPSRASVVVIGGGIMGCSTLYHLATMGLGDAVLVERNRLTSGTTWHSAAQVRALRHSRNLTRMIQYSIDLYSRLERDTGQAVGWIQKGSLSIATTPDRLVHIRRQEALAHSFGLAAHFVSAAEAGEIWPLMNTADVLGAVFSPGDGRVSPSDVCAALVKGAKAAGARLFENTGVTGVLTERGRITGVETERGMVACDAIALCAGLWSREVAAWAGADAPLWPCEHFYLLTKPVEGLAGNLPTLSDHDRHLYIRDDSGGLLVGCFEPRGKPLDPARLGAQFAFQLLPEDWAHFEPMMRNALHRLPALHDAEVKTLLNGPESFTPDGAFMLGETAQTRGLYLGCGMNSVGVASAGGAGMNLAHCIVHGRPAYDLSEVDAKRFAPVFNRAEHLAARTPEVLGRHYEIAYPGRQWRTARNLRRAPLHAEWRNRNARFGQFFGFERPLYFDETAEPKMTFGRPHWFEQVGREVMHAHRGAAVFDQSTLGKIRVEGPDAEAFVQRVCMSDMRKAPGRVIYTAMLNERGGLESDLTAQRIGEQHYRLFVGSGAVKRDAARLIRHRDATPFRVRLCDCTDDFAVIALMGPEAQRIVTQLGAPELNELKYFHHDTAQIAGRAVRAARLSYVGEFGWEITCQNADAAAICAAMRKAGAQPAGLFAQTAMRIEKKFPAFGHELDTDITPVEAGLEFAVAWDTDFIGREALMQHRDRGAKTRLVTLLLDDLGAVPLGQEPVRAQGEIAGETTSAAFGYRIGRPVALAWIRAGVPEGASVEIDIGRERFTAALSEAPAFDPGGGRMRG